MSKNRMISKQSWRAAWRWRPKKTRKNKRFRKDLRDISSLHPSNGMWNDECSDCSGRDAMTMTNWMYDSPFYEEKNEKTHADDVMFVEGKSLERWTSYWFTQSSSKGSCPGTKRKRIDNEIRLKERNHGSEDTETDGDETRRQLILISTIWSVF